MEQNNNVGLESQTSEGVNQSTQEEEVISIPKSQYLSELDKARTEAAKTREKSLQKKTEMTLSEMQRKIEDLEFQNRMKDLAIETKNRLAEIDALDVLPLFDFDFTDINARVDFAKKVKEMASSQADKKIKEKISTNTTAPTNIKTSNQPVAFRPNMSPEEAKRFLENKK